jgi:hypothetical protein
VFGDQQLVGGDHGFPRAQRLAHPFPGRLEPADQLDDHVGVGEKHVVDVFRPANSAGKRARFFLLDAAIENVREDQRAAGVLSDDFRDRAAHGAEADERDPQAPVRGRGFSARAGLRGLRL